METCENIILITVDCFRYDRCDFNGYEHLTTPFLTSVAEDAVIYDQAYATGPYTPELFPGLLAGLHAADTQYVGDLICKAIPNETPTVTSRLQAAGYRTVAGISNPHLSTDRNYNMGFDVFENLRVKSDTSMVKKKRCRK